MIPIGVMLQLENIPGEAVQKAYAMAEARRVFKQRYTRSWLAKIWAVLTRRSSRMLDLKQAGMQHAAHDRHYAGLQTVRIEQIRGSENRGSDFDVHFNPVRLHTKDRWINVAVALIEGKNLPPVELIQVGETYFVRDGHHRISAARALGQQEIEAVVTEWTVEPKKAATACISGPTKGSKGKRCAHGIVPLQLCC